MALSPIFDAVSRRSLVVTAAIATLVAGAGIRPQQPPRFGERVEVARIIIDARVLDDRGIVFPTFMGSGRQLPGTRQERRIRGGSNLSAVNGPVGCVDSARE